MLLEGKVQLVEQHVSGSDDMPSRQIIAPVAPVISRVAQEHTRYRTRAEFISGCCGLVGIAQAAEHAEVGIVRRRAEKELVRGV